MQINDLQHHKNDLFQIDTASKPAFNPALDANFHNLLESWKCGNIERVIACIQNSNELTQSDLAEIVHANLFYSDIFPILMNSLFRPGKDHPVPQEFEEPLLISVLTMLQNIIPFIELNENQLKEMIIRINSMFDIEEFCPINDISIGILTKLIERGGHFSIYVQDYFRLSGFIRYLAITPLKSEAVNFIRHFDELALLDDESNANMFVDVIRNCEFSEADRLALIKLSLDFSSKTFKYYEPSELLLLLYNYISALPEVFENSQADSLKCLSLFIQKSGQLFDFDYSYVFRCCGLVNDIEIPLDNNIFDSAMCCLISIAESSEQGFAMFKAHVDINIIIHRMLSEYHSIIEQKRAVVILNTYIRLSKLIGETRESIISSMNLAEVTAFLVQLLDLEDVKVVEEIFKCFEFFEGGEIEDHDQISNEFNAMLEENDGWATIFTMSNNENTKLANMATLFTCSHADLGPLPLDEDESP